MRSKYYKQFHSRPFGSNLISSFFIVIFCLPFSDGISPHPTVAAKESTPASNLPTSNDACKQVLPGLRKLGLGVDVTKLDLLPLSFTTADGFKNPVIDFSCKEGKQRNLNGSGYDIPDQVVSVTNKPGGILRSGVEIFKKSSDVLKMMSASVGLELKGIFSASASYKRMTSNFYYDSCYVERVVSHQSTRTAELVPTFALKLGNYAKMHVDWLLPNSFESDPKKYFRFIEYFGTHYFSRLYFGGTLQYYLETNNSYYRGKSDRAVKAEASASFFNLIKVGGSYSHEVKTVDKNFIKSTKMFIRYYGGDANLLAAGGISKWQPTISKNPWIFAGKLKSISELIEDNSKRNSMEKATQIYIDKAYIDSLMDLLNSALKRYPLFYQKISGYKNQLKALNESDHNAVIKLGNKLEEELEVPSWFLDNVQLCYKWSPDDDIGQCGGGVGRHLCANAGFMTTYYRDDTDGRSGGCRMQWGIQKPTYISQSWLQQTKICYQWCCTDSRCSSGATKNVCAFVSQFTPEYGDSSDSYNKGCQMQWRLVVPDAAPIWYRSMKLCFEWYADGDGGQCGGGADKLLCAMANSWTTVYKDRTDNRNGGCFMRWGIIPS